GQLLLQLADLLNGAVAEHQRLEHLLFGQLVAETFDHQHRRLCSGNDEVESAGFQLFLPGEEHELLVDETDANTRKGPLKRDRGRHRQGRTGPNDGQHVGVVFTVTGQNVAHDLYLVGVPLGKEGTDGAVDEAGGENLFERRPAFTLQKSARKLTG